MTLTKMHDDSVEVLSPREASLENLLKSKPQGLFPPNVMDFLTDLTEVLLDDKDSRLFPDVLAFALWCRSLKEQTRLNSESDHGIRLGRGVIFHVTPSNVPINFAYSLVTGLVTGNTNIVRLTSKKFPQIEFLISAINSILDLRVHEEVKSRFMIIRYPKDKTINDLFSSNCDVRVIWGGDQSIREIRQSEIPGKSFDITFSDRYSFCVISAQEYLKSKEKIAIAQGFYNDTYLFDQNACTAPHLIVWLGDKESSREAQSAFWQNLEPIVEKRYGIEPIQVMDKLVASVKFSSNHPSAKMFRTVDNKIIRFEISELEFGIEEYKCHSGFFFEIQLEKLQEVTPYISSKFQTMSYYGLNISELELFVKRSQLYGIDRVVPIGKTLDFSFVWDGFNLIETMSRNVQIIQSEKNSTTESSSANSK